MGLHSKLTAKGQTTIPQAVREHLKLAPGDRLSYVLKDGKVELRARNLRAVDLIGILGPPPAGPGLAIEEMDDAVADAVAEDEERVGREWKEGIV